MSFGGIIEKDGKRYLRDINPATLALVDDLPAASRADVSAAVARARAAQPAWAAMPVRERCRILTRVGRLLRERMDEMAQVMSAETGKPRREALLDVVCALDYLEFYTQVAPRLLSDHAYRLRAKWKVVDARAVFEPWGVVALIGPWNYPLAIPMGAMVPALAAGNAVVVKPSEHTPLTLLRTQAWLHEAGLPEGVVEVVVGDRDVGAALTSEKIDRLVFTGSVATGKKVAAACAERMVPVTLELGGSDPAIVRADADLSYAARGITWGRFVTSGQTCVAIKRVFVHRAIADAFVERVVAEVKKLRVGPDSQYDVDMGPLISEAQRAQIEGQLADAVQRGAQVAAGGKRPAGLAGYFLEPTVLTQVDPASRVMHEETFGPILPIVVVDSDDEAVARANESRFGLMASVWGKDVRAARELGRRLEAGMVLVNNTALNFIVAETPWGGIKESGLGHTHGVQGLLDMCRSKLLVTPRVSLDAMPWWYPLSTGEAGYRALARMIGGLYGGRIGSLLKGAVALVREKRRHARP